MLSLFDRKAKLQKLKSLLPEFLSGQALDFVLGQVQQHSKSPHARRWSPKDKAFAMPFFHSSRKAYERLEKTFAMPSQRTLRRAVQNLEVGCHAHVPYSNTMHYR